MGKIYKALEKFKEEIGSTENEDNRLNAVESEEADGILSSPMLSEQPIDANANNEIYTSEEVEKESLSSPMLSEQPIDANANNEINASEEVEREFLSSTPPLKPPPPFPLQQPLDENVDSISLPVKCKLDGSIVSHYKPHSLESEQFRLLKTAILFPEKGEPPRTIMVTSTSPGEGKTFVAANLAVSIANSVDEYVLLIDCSLRRPSIHKIFGFPDNTPGLSEYLTNKLPLSKLLLRNVIDKLTILPCGKPPDNPSELISSEQMRQLITEVKTRYDDRYIIIDSPPPYITAEANALARQVDSIIIVVKTGRTQLHNLRDLVDTYGKDKILGIVKNFDQPLPFFRTKYNYGYKA